MSTAANLSVQLSLQAMMRRRREEREREACAQFMPAYQDDTATAAEKREYAYCVKLMVPPEPSKSHPFNPSPHSAGLVIVLAAATALGLWWLMRYNRRRL